MSQNTNPSHSGLKHPGGILEDIIAHKIAEVSEARSKVSITRLEESELFDRECYKLKDFIANPQRTGIIAEFKRASPSKGTINADADVSVVTRQYAEGGASALSVLTDNKFFGGSMRDLMEARAANDIPILRKDFMIDEYQIIEARAIGADVILLIASVLSPDRVRALSALSKNLGLSVLLEVHNLQELEESLCDTVDAVGVNNRNLSNFSVSVDRSYELVKSIPASFVRVSESGISNVETIKGLKDAGYNGFLIGENFMKEPFPGKAMQTFVAELSNLA